MRYLGGKSRYAKAIAAVINPVRAGRVLWDPFCGGLASAAAFGGELVCSDINPGLIALYREVQRDVHWLDGLDDPSVPTPALRTWAKANRADPLAALVLHGTGFGGDPNGGFAGHDTRTGRSYLGETCRNLTRCFRTLNAALFDVCNFLTCRPHSLGAVLYLDPPYPGTTGYGIEFDHDLFRARARAWAAVTDVWVSGYEWPADAGALVWEAPAGGKRGLPTKGRERLWKVRP